MLFPFLYGCCQKMALLLYSWERWTKLSRPVGSQEKRKTLFHLCLGDVFEELVSTNQQSSTHRSMRRWPTLWSADRLIITVRSSPSLSLITTMRCCVFQQKMWKWRRRKATFIYCVCVCVERRISPKKPLGPSHHRVPPEWKSKMKRMENRRGLRQCHSIWCGWEKNKRKKNLKEERKVIWMTTTTVYC